MEIEPIPRQIEVLEDIACAVSNYLRVCGMRWVRPLDCGGSNGSDHSYRLGQLAKSGLAWARVRSRGRRGSLVYTISPDGLSELERMGIARAAVLLAEKDLGLPAGFALVRRRRYGDRWMVEEAGCGGVSARDL